LYFLEGDYLMQGMGHVRYTREKRRAYKGLVGKPEGHLDLQYWRILLQWILRIEWGVLNWIYLAEIRDQGRVVVNTVMIF
jgi:hypothetical protein